MKKQGVGATCSLFFSVLHQHQYEKEFIDNNQSGCGCMPTGQVPGEYLF